MRIAVTGAGGFLGWHVRCRAFAAGLETVAVPRAMPAEALQGVDAVVHCAGVSRGSEAQVLEGNLAAANGLAEALRRVDRPIRVVYANSVQSRGESPDGQAKRKAAELLAGAATGGFSDVMLPWIFGEHGRPYHNSFVATFCRELANGRRPAEVRERELVLLHAQDAAEVLLRQASAGGEQSIEPAGEPTSVVAVLALLERFAATYRNGDLPPLTSAFQTQLFHTYRSHLFPHALPIQMRRGDDARGSLVVCVRAAGGEGEVIISTTVPGAVRGEHVHLRKFERFVVMDGRAEIALRRLFTSDVVRFRVSGEQPVAIDIPTLWTHRITGLDTRAVTSLIWVSERYRPEDCDTYPCPVEASEGVL